MINSFFKIWPESENFTEISDVESFYLLPEMLFLVSDGIFDIELPVVSITEFSGYF